MHAKSLLLVHNRKTTMTPFEKETVAPQIATGCFINTKGRDGCSLPCDLHLEHLNRRLKTTFTQIFSHKHSYVQLNE